MPDYDLVRLGSRTFEQLVVSLCRKELGPAMTVFGDGPDGGREATFEGAIQWSSTVVEPSSDDRWTGLTVLQAKYRLKPSSRTQENAVWLQSQIRREIHGWTKAAATHSRAQLPDYMIFITNVDLSAVAGSGGVDTIREYVADLTGPDSDARRAGLFVRGVKVWHADQVRTMIDAHQDVRYAFDGLLTIGDVLAALARDHPIIGSLNRNLSTCLRHR